MGERTCIVVCCSGCCSCVPANESPLERPAPWLLRHRGLRRRPPTMAGACRRRTSRRHATAALSQINASNARGLHPVWSFSTGVLGGHEGQPLVVEDTMYVVTPWPNVLYAFDLTQRGLPAALEISAGCRCQFASGSHVATRVNRGAFFAAGKIIYNLLDGHTVAVDAKTGREIWKTQVADLGSGETMTMAPFVVKDRVIVGASGGEFGIYGWIKGLDLATGQDRVDRTQSRLRRRHAGAGRHIQAPLWRGNRLGQRAAGLTESWRTGGAPVWGWMSYDPHLDLVFYGTGNPAPYNPEQRPGDNKWSASVLARRPEDGSLVWAYQFTPHDNWDFDATGAMILADLTVGGRPVAALVHFDKNGFAYTLDRATGRVLVAAAFAPVNWARSVDLVDRACRCSSRTKQTGVSRGNVQGICPSLEGGVSPSSPPAYSPRTRLFYTSTNNLCMDYADAPARSIFGARRSWASTSPYFAGPGGYLGSFIAWDAAARAARSGKTRKPIRTGAARSLPRAMSCSTARWTVGSKRSMRDRASCCRNSRSAPAWWVTRSPIVAPTANSTWRCMRVSVATGR